MTISKKVMKEVLESEKSTIEELTNRISLLEEQLDEANKYKDLYQELIIKFNLLDEENKILKKQNKELLQKLEKYEKTEKRSGIVGLKNSEEYLKIVKERDKYKKDYDNLNIRIHELENTNKMENNIDESFINNKINEALISQKNVFDSVLKEKESNYKSLYDNFNKLNQEFLKLKNNNEIPSPTSSTENKKVKKITLPNNLDLVVYYRYVNNNNYLPTYFIEKNKKYLRCCNTDYKNKEISDKNNITCSKCFRTYKLLESENNNYKLI